MVQLGHVVSLVKLCQWLGLSRRTLYYSLRPRRRTINTELTKRVKLALEQFPTYGYRRLVCVLGENRKPIRRILQLKAEGAQAATRLPAGCPGHAVRRLSA